MVSGKFSMIEFPRNLIFQIIVNHFNLSIKIPIILLKNIAATFIKINSYFKYILYILYDNEYIYIYIVNMEKKQQIIFKTNG